MGPAGAHVHEEQRGEHANNREGRARQEGVGMAHRAVPLLPSQDVREGNACLEAPTNHKGGPPAPASKVGRDRVGAGSSGGGDAEEGLADEEVRLEGEGGRVVDAEGSRSRGRGGGDGMAVVEGQNGTLSGEPGVGVRCTHDSDATRRRIREDPKNLL